MRALVTGAQGFVGRFLVEALLQHEAAEVLGVGRSRRSVAPFAELVPAETADARYTYQALDIRSPDLAPLVERFRPTVVFHLASGLRDDPAEQLIAIGVEGTLAVLETIARAAIPSPRIVIASSGGVYGIPQRFPIGESDPCAPIEPYSASKLAAERIAEALARAYGLDVVRARLFNLIGPGQDERHASARFAIQFVAIAAGTLGVIETGDLTPTRDFIDVRDSAAALVTLAAHGHRGHAYNVGSGKETSIELLFDLTRRAAGVGRAVRIRTYHRSADIPRHFADIEALREIGYRPRFDLARSVWDVVAYYVERLAAASAPQIDDVSAAMELESRTQG